MRENLEIPVLDLADLAKLHFVEQSNIPISNPLFTINRIQDRKTKISFPLPPHRKPVYDLILITKGESKRTKGLNAYHFSKNQLFFLPAFQITKHESMSDDIEGFYLHFSPKLFLDFQRISNEFSFLKFHTNPIVSLPEESIDAITNILNRLIWLHDHVKIESNRHIFASYLTALFYETNSHVEPTPITKINSAYKLTQQFKDLLSQNIYTHRTIADYADTLNVTPNHLNKCVRECMSKTAQNLLIEMQIMEAKSLLKYSDLPVADIAFKLLNYSATNFSRFFKSQTGITPSQYQHD